MNKLRYMMSAVIALVLGIGFATPAKATNFQKKLAKCINVSVKDKSIQPICEKCDRRPR